MKNTQKIAETSPMVKRRSLSRDRKSSAIGDQQKTQVVSKTSVADAQAHNVETSVLSSGSVSHRGVEMSSSDTKFMSSSEMQSSTEVNQAFLSSSSASAAAVETTTSAKSAAMHESSSMQVSSSETKSATYAHTQGKMQERLASL